MQDWNVTLMEMNESDHLLQELGKAVTLHSNLRAKRTRV